RQVEAFRGEELGVLPEVDRLQPTGRGRTRSTSGRTSVRPGVTTCMAELKFGPTTEACSLPCACPAELRGARPGRDSLRTAPSLRSAPAVQQCRRASRIHSTASA